jgi:hypothetical protein
LGAENGSTPPMTNPYYVPNLPLPPLDTIEDDVRAVTCGGDRRIMNYALWEARQDCSRWLALFQALANMPRPSVDCRKAFFEVLTGDHGLRVRDHFLVDPLVPAALANLAPGYSGPPVELFRGERWSNHLNKAYGFSWTTIRKTAEMFAKGLNCFPPEGGVLLTTITPARAILSEPNDHSRYLEEDEYVIDRRALEEVIVVKRFLNAE